MQPPFRCRACCWPTGDPWTGDVRNETVPEKLAAARLAGEAALASSEASDGSAKTKRYAAFISYSHADSDICDRLHGRLENYSIPHSLVGRPGPAGRMGKRLGKFFRDRADLGAHHDLGAEIREALNASGALIVLCSPKSATSQYVDGEIRYFKSLGRGDRIFTAIISGEPHAAGKPGFAAGDECFPRALIYRVSEDGALTENLEPSEPIAADLRHKKDGLESGSLKLIAGLLDIGLDDLVQREKQAEARRRRRAYLISGGMGVLALGAGAGGVLAYINGEVAAKRAIDLALANQALDQRAKDLQLANTSLDVAKKDVERRLRENQALTTRMSSVLDEVSEVAESDPAVSEKLLFLSLGARQGVSAFALNAIFETEFGSEQTLRISSHGGLTQLCMGFDYCAGDFSVEQMRADWEGMMPPEEVDRIAAVWGADIVPTERDNETADPRHTAAMRIDRELADIGIGRKQAFRVYARAQLPVFTERVRKIWPDADLLPPDSFGALVFLVVYAGTGQLSRLVTGIADGTYADAAVAIRSLGPKLSARMSNEAVRRIVLSRFNEMADIFQRGATRIAGAAKDGATGSLGNGGGPH